METIIVHDTDGTPLVEVPTGSIALSPVWMEARRLSREAVLAEETVLTLGETAIEVQG